MNFLRGFIIFASLAVATIQARESTRPDDYVEGEEELDFNSKVLLEAIKKNKEQMMNQIKLMDQKIENFYKHINEEKNSKSILIDEILELKQRVIEEQNTTALLQSKNLELNQRIQECCGQILDKDGTEDIFQALVKDSLNGVKYWYWKDPSSINAKNVIDANRTPLHYASSNGQLDIVEFLLSKGVDVDEEDTFSDETPLMSASNNGNVHIVEALLDKGADINHQDRDKWTPLHYAVEGNKLPVVKLLIERGADRSLKDVVDKTPLDWARENGKKSIEDYLWSL